MNILFLTVNRDNRVATHFKQFQEILGDLYKIDIITRNLPDGYKLGKYASKVMKHEIIPENILDDIHKKYDVIITDADYAFVHENWNDIKAIKAVIIEDAHKEGNCSKQVYWMNKNKIDVVFYKYKKFIYNHIECKVPHKIWLPHSIDVNLFKDYKEDKKYNVLMAGWHFKKIYPYRHKAYELLKNKKYFTEIKRPGECVAGNINNKWPIKEDYAKVLNQSKICITGGSIFNFPVMKYFEIPASRSCLVSNWFDELGDLGFIANENIIIADYDNLDYQMKKLLDGDWEKIAENGYKLIREKHSTIIRAKEMIKCLKKI